MDWEDLRIFAALAQTGSLAGTGRLLRVNHATVSRRVAALEAALGTRLVDRLARSTPLTEAGVEIAMLATEMGLRADAIRRVARDHSVELSGTVSLSAPPVIASMFLAPRMHAFAERHPNLTIALQSELGIVSLDRGEADMAIRISGPDQPDHAARKLGLVRLGLYASPSLATEPPDRWRFIGYGPELSHVPHHHWFEGRIAGRPVPLRTSDVVAQCTAALAGLGVAMLPTFYADREAGLVEVGSARDIPQRCVWLMIHPDVRRSTPVRTVAEHLERIFAEDDRFSD